MLTAVEISTISMSLRESAKNAKKANLEDAKEYYKMLDKLGKRFQRLAVKIEVEVLSNI